MNNLEVTRVDLVDDLEVTGEEVLNHGYRPALQGLGQESVVGVGEGLGACVPRLVPWQLLHVKQESHQLWDGQCRVGVIQLDSALQGNGASAIGLYK